MLTERVRPWAPTHAGTFGRTTGGTRASVPSPAPAPSQTDAVALAAAGGSAPAAAPLPAAACARLSRPCRRPPGLRACPRPCRAAPPATCRAALRSSFPPGADPDEPVTRTPMPLRCTEEAPEPDDAALPPPLPCWTGATAGAVHRAGNGRNPLDDAGPSAGFTERRARRSRRSVRGLGAWRGDDESAGVRAFDRQRARPAAEGTEDAAASGRPPYPRCPLRRLPLPLHPPPPTGLQHPSRGRRRPAARSSPAGSRSAAAPMPTPSASAARIAA